VLYICFIIQSPSPADEKALSRVSGWGVGSKFGTPKTEKISNHKQFIHNKIKKSL
jgi:hypothetical protein